ncbi:hypothetical protein OVA06_12880 [Pseudarthrobacter sp. SL88]|uniref:hypothetical protein n=1 Tax=Pseudarthrobacter sp. SL88 TaxID=2994666 RepID=UPI002275CA44|nr:hypothetical protein [Pseudarthrobacter sp. SL88]MCY1675589.1 hypothetical protein [Pseudarthrobacter sp. SL88]
MKNWLTRFAIPITGAASLAGLAAPATAAPPVSADQTLPDFGAGELCAFPVRIEITGKTKLIGDWLEDHKTTSPGFKVTTTNLASGKTVKYTATGSSRYTVATDKAGNKYFEVVSTGQNLLFSPELGGLFFVRGNVNYAVTLDLPENQQEVRPFVPSIERLNEANAVNICGPLS